MTNDQNTDFPWTIRTNWEKLSKESVNSAWPGVYDDDDDDDDTILEIIILFLRL